MSRTKKATQSAAAGEAGPPTRYHPGEGYQPVEGTTIGSGALSAAGEELWLIRVPREVRMDQLDGTTLQLQDGHAAGAMGSLAIKHGRVFELVCDDDSLASQLYAMAPADDGLHPCRVARHVSLLPDLQLVAVPPATPAPQDTPQLGKSAKKKRKHHAEEATPAAKEKKSKHEKKEKDRDAKLSSPADKKQKKEKKDKKKRKQDKE
eukprot:jgi/Tetstr1/436944/TSEL_025716.t1